MAGGVVHLLNVCAKLVDQRDQLAAIDGVALVQVVDNGAHARDTLLQAADNRGAVVVRGHLGKLWGHGDGRTRNLGKLARELDDRVVLVKEATNRMRDPLERQRGNNRGYDRQCDDRPDGEVDPRTDSNTRPLQQRYHRECPFWGGVFEQLQVGSAELKSAKETS